MCEHVYEFAHIFTSDLCYGQLRKQMAFRDSERGGKEQTDETHLASYPTYPEVHFILENQPLANISKAKSRSSP